MIKFDVFEDLQNAIVNGCSFSGMEAIEIAYDLIECTGEYDDIHIEELIVYIEEFLQDV
jgi:hypothetical protein